MLLPKNTKITNESISSLTQLKYLKSLRYIPDPELKPTNLRLTDFSFLEKLDNLTELALSIDSKSNISNKCKNQLTSFECSLVEPCNSTDILKGMKQLETLKFYHDLELEFDSSDEQKRFHISPLEEFKKLRTLVIPAYFDGGEILPKLNHLTSLSFRRVRKNTLTQGMEYLQDLKNLRFLDVSEVSIASPALLETLTNLHTLKFSFVDDLSFLKKLTNLEEIVMERCKDIKDFNPFQNLTKLRALSMKYSDIDLSCFSFFNDRLRSLNLAGSKIYHFRSIKDFHKLRSLSLANTHFDGEGIDLSYLTELKFLRLLDLTGCDIVDVNLPILKNSRKLNNLKLKHTFCLRSKKLYRVYFQKCDLCGYPRE